MTSTQQSNILTTVDPSDMLAAALEQMDGLIAGFENVGGCSSSGGTQFDFNQTVSNDSTASSIGLPESTVNGVVISNKTLANSTDCRRMGSSTHTVDKIIEELVSAITFSMNSGDDLLNHTTIVRSSNDVDSKTKAFLVKWLTLSDDNQPAANGLSPDHEDLQDKVHRLTGDKENLTLQVSVLHEQIEAQTDKIRDMETALDTKKGQLENVEDMLQHGLITLESQKLNLMSEISKLKLRMTAIEKDKLDIEERYRKSELDVISLKTQLSEKEREIILLKSQVTGRSQSGIQSSPDVTKSSYHVSPENSLRKVQQRYLEMDKLRKALECVMAANDEKDRRIIELENASARSKHAQDRVFNSNFRKSNSVTTEEEDENEIAAVPPAQSPIGLNLKYKVSDFCVTDKPPSAPRNYLSSTRLPSKSELVSTNGPRSPPTPVSVKSSPGSQRATSFEEIASAVPPETPPSRTRHGVDSYGTIPRKHGGFGNSSSNNNGLSAKEMSYRSVNNPDLDPFRSHSRQKSTGLSFGKGFFWLKTGKRSNSAPNLGPTESSTNGDQTPAPPQSPQILDSKQKPKGIKRIFGKLKRSNSQHLEDAPGEFRRGGVRSTAGPRLGWSNELKGYKEGVDVPFARWDGEKIASWMHDMGLTAYIGDCKRWVKSGEQLLRATHHDLEKELGIKHPLHRKKLQLALQAIGSADAGDVDVTDALDHVWVTRWLDDVGLPQYKDTFSESRVDGRMLNFMTVEDLFLLKVTNLLHYLSLKRGIQVLRQNNFNPSCLKRRPDSDENGNPSSSTDVVLWTNHRVMEWLRLVDLSEYAPNLRGSGVHGALMIYEPRFNAELLATLLSIPLNKTLLRRHLSTHFKQLVGPEIVKQKRELEASPLFIALTPGTKIKATRRSQFSLIRKRNKNDIEYEDYVCPHDLLTNGNSRISESEKASTKDDKSKARPGNSIMLNASPFADKHL